MRRVRVAIVVSAAETHPKHQWIHNLAIHDGYKKVGEVEECKAEKLPHSAHWRC